MVDTDKDWTLEARQKAKTKGIILLPSEPCFEAVMLRILGENLNANTQKLKKQFAPFVQYKATEFESYQEHFSASKLLANRLNAPSIDHLLRILGA